MSAAETITREIRQAVRDETRKVLREELPAILARVADEEQERRARRLALRLEAESPKLGDDEVGRLRSWLAANEATWRPVSRTPVRWLKRETRNPRRETVERWWTRTLGRTGPELLELLEGGDEPSESGAPDQETAAV